MFYKKQIGNPNHDRRGKFSKSDYKIILRKKRWTNFLIIEIGLATTLLVVLCDLTAQKVAEAIYPPIKAVEAQIESNLSLQEYVFEEVRSELGIDNAIKAVTMIGGCENKQWNIEATYNNGDYGIDRGLWQINSKYHPEVSWECAYNKECSTKEAIRIIKERGFEEWSCGK